MSGSSRKTNITIPVNGQVWAKGLLCLLFALGLSTTGVLGISDTDVTVEAGPDAQIDNLAFADELRTILGDPDHEDDLEKMFAVGRTALANRVGLVGSLLPESTGFALEQQQRNLDAAEQLLALEEASYESDLHRAVALAKEGAYRQSLTVGPDWADPIPLEGHMLPSSALIELAARHGVEPTQQEQVRIDELDELDEPLRRALARFVDAFLALETAARIAYTDADIEALERLLEDVRALEHHDVGLDDPDALANMEPTPSSGDTLQDMGVDLTLVVPTRNQFLDAILDLNDALTNHGVVTMSSCAPTQVPPVFSIDLVNCDNRYTQDFALLLDAGGDDRYHNNAGGAGTPSPTSPTACGFPNVMPTAALVDLGGGNNEYGDPANPKRCGAAGGAAVGVAFLLDAGGDDRYTADRSGTNGGGAAGAGFLLDAGGNDIYTSGPLGTNGGGILGGGGFLLDAGGDDLYTAGGEGTNGGGIAGGGGFLLDASGNDIYTAGDDGTNGGGNFGGVGFLLDADGNEIYTAGKYGTNGGAYLGGAGFLLDALGEDTYIADNSGTNGGGSAGAGLLLDAAGDDTYTADYGGTNGGASAGSGLLLDASGDDTYTAGSGGTNGGGDLGAGSLLDLDGTDHYQDSGIPDGSCWDCNVFFKGWAGAQLDSDETLPFP